MSELEQKLCTMLDALADGTATLVGASRAAVMYDRFCAACIKHSEGGDPDYVVSWRNENARQFCELVALAQRMGQVAREQELRGIVINGQIQYVQDPALLARFGFDDDAKDLAELSGFPDFPFAHDVDGNRIPLLSARFPRPQRQHRPHPWKKQNSPPPDAVGEQSSETDTGIEHRAAGDLPIRDWRPDDPEPPYSRRVRCAAPPPVVNIPTPASPRVMTPMRADLLERLKHLKEHGPENPRPTRPVHVIRQHADDPPEQITGRE